MRGKESKRTERRGMVGGGHTMRGKKTEAKGVRGKRKSNKR